MTWSNTAWQAGSGIYTQIIKMPFIQELISGTLAPGKFKFYIAQDSLYLASFGRALSLIAARAQERAQALAFMRFAEGALVVEQALHAEYFQKLDIPVNTPISPTCQHYTHYLLTQASLAPLEVAMAAVLPCFRIYQEVGHYIYTHHHGSQNPYQDWIDTYASEAFGQLVTHASAICDQVAASCPPAQQEAMTRAYLTATKLEWMFWNSAYNLETWPL